MGINKIKGKLKQAIGAIDEKRGDVVDDQETVEEAQKAQVEGKIQATEGVDDEKAAKEAEAKHKAEKK